MPSVYEVIQSFRAQVLAADADAAITLTKAYRRVNERLQKEIDELAQAIAALEADGQPVTRGKLLRMQRYRALESQLLDELQRLSDLAEGVITQGQSRMVSLGSEQALRGTLASLPAGTTELSLAGSGIAWNRLPTDAVTSLAGALSDGSPLRDLLDELPRDTAAGVRDKLLQGVGMGRNPRKVAAEITDELGMGLTRSLTISSTEMLRAYRTASLAQYEANRHIIQGWEWVAARSSRTCVACLAMDGTVHELGEFFPAHPNCRCSPRPRTRSWRELGFPVDEPQRTRQTAAEWFAKQDDATQLEVLGYSRYEMYKLGEAKLIDFVGHREHARWGKSVAIKPVRELKAA